MKQVVRSYPASVYEESCDCLINGYSLDLREAVYDSLIIPVEVSVSVYARVLASREIIRL